MEKSIRDRWSKLEKENDAQIAQYTMNRQTVRKMMAEKKKVNYGDAGKPLERAPQLQAQAQVPQKVKIKVYK